MIFFTPKGWKTVSFTIIVPELNLTLNEVESQKVSVAVGLLAVIEDEAVRMMTQEPDLDVERLAHVTQGEKLDKTEMARLY